MNENTPGNELDTQALRDSRTRMSNDLSDAKRRLARIAEIIDNHSTIDTRRGAWWEK